MKTDFFSKISTLGNFQASIALTFDKSANRFSVSFLPKPLGENPDPATERLKPFSISATTEEMDDAFFKTIITPIKETLAIFDNAQEYIEQKRVMEQQTQREKDKKAALKKKEDALTKLLEGEEKIKANAKKITNLAGELKRINPSNKVAAHALEKVGEATAQNSLF